jgi:hypothetical protein
MMPAHNSGAAPMSSKLSGIANTKSRFATIRSA